jgi:CO dehydrogenase maturation factor
LIRALLESGEKVLAIDADPDENFAHAQGVKSANEIISISKLKDWIEERTEAKEGSMGSVLNLNPKVSDLPETLLKEMDGVKVMVMGGVKIEGTSTR